MVSWLLGPPGDLRELVTPETGINITEVRYGGVHQGLNGARTMDVTGVKTNIDLTMDYLDEADYRWLQALHTRHIPGPHRLINPLRKNKLSIYAASCNMEPMQNRALYFDAGTADWVADWPTAAGPGWQSVRWYNRVGTSTARWDADKKFTCTPGEAITASVYLKGNSSFTMTTAIDWYDKYNVYLSSTSGSAAVTNTWTRFSLTGTPPAGAYLGFFAMYSASTVETRIAAAQVELGSSATAWDQGGGDLMVLIDQMPATSPRYPLMNATLGLLEA